MDGTSWTPSPPPSSPPVVFTWGQSEGGALGSCQDRLRVRSGGGGGETRRCQWLRRKDARVCGRQGCGPGGPVRGRLDLQAPRALPPARGWEGYGASWQPAALGKPVRGEAKPQGPLANAADLKKRVTRQLDCCPPRLPPARGNYLTGSSPLPPEARQTNRIQSPH